MGLHLDLPLDRDTPAVRQAVADLAEAVAAIAGSDDSGVGAGEVPRAEDLAEDRGQGSE